MRTIDVARTIESNRFVTGVTWFDGGARQHSKREQGSASHFRDPDGLVIAIHSHSSFHATRAILSLERRPRSGGLHDG